MLLRLEDRFPELRHDSLTSGAIIAAFVAAGVLAGYVIASGKPIPIALTLGAIAGVALLNALPLVIWVVLIGVLLFSGPVTMFVPELAKVGWLFSLLGFFLIGAAVLYAAVGRERFTRPLPAFVVMAILLVVYGLLSILYSGGPLSEGIRAGKRYFQFFGILFVLAVVPFPPALVRRWWMFLVGLAILQLPFAIYQRAVLMPGRETMPGVVPVDIVVGTMEGSLTGGGSSGVMALLIVLILSFLLSAHRDGILSTIRLLLLAAALVAPLTLSQVNVIIVLLPLALAAVYFDLIRRRPLRFVLGVVLTLPVLAAASLTYLMIDAEPGQTLAAMIDGVIEYNFGEKPYYDQGLNRTSVYRYWIQQHDFSNPVALLFGHGLGSSFGGVLEPNPGHMDLANARMYIGLTAASSALWDLGLLGFLLLLALCLSAIRHASQLGRLARPGFDRAFCRALHAMALMLPAMLFYSNGAIATPSQEVVTALCVGLIAWRWRIARPSNEARDAFRQT